MLYCSSLSFIFSSPFPHSSFYPFPLHILLNILLTPLPSLSFPPFNRSLCLLLLNIILFFPLFSHLLTHLCICTSTFPFFHPPWPLVTSPDPPQVYGLTNGFKERKWRTKLLLEKGRVGNANLLPLKPLGGSPNLKVCGGFFFLVFFFFYNFSCCFCSSYFFLFFFLLFVLLFLFFLLLLLLLLLPMLFSSPESIFLFYSLFLSFIFLCIHY